LGTQKHIIRRQIVEIEVPSVESSWDIQNRISNLSNYGLLQVLESVFDAMAGPDEILRIDRLEIDLGNVPTNRMEEEIEKRVGEKLTQLISEIKAKANGVAAIDPTNEVELKQRPLQAGKTDLLIHFLRTGTTPWWYSRAEFGSPLELLREMLQLKPEWIRKWLTPLLKEKQVRQRLVAHLNELELMRFITIFNSELAEKARVWISLVLNEKIHARKKGNDSFETVNSIRFLFWEKIVAQAATKYPDVLRQFISEYQFILEGKLSAAEKKEIEKFAEIIGQKPELILADKKMKAELKKRPKRIRKKKKSDSDPVIEAKDDEMQDQAEVWLDDEIETDAAESDSEIETVELVDDSDGTNELKEKTKSGRKRKRKLKKNTSEISAEAADGIKSNKKKSASEKMAATSRTAEAEADKIKQVSLNEKQNTSKTKANEIEQELLKEKSAAEKATQDEIEKDTAITIEDLSDFVIDNAGLVLIWPFLGPYFKELGLTQDRKFVNEEAVSRAVHLIQYLAEGDEYEYEEHDLVLNKILCGIDVTQAIDMNFEITEQEKEEAEALLKAVTQNWTIIKNTSIQGLRMSFLMKDGSLKKNEQGWHLYIERATIDMLIDRLPWAISMIRLPWMSGLLYVEW
jgi:Contractile injection system tape measure protein